MLVTHTPPPSLLARHRSRNGRRTGVRGRREDGARRGAGARTEPSRARFRSRDFCARVREGDLLAIEADDERVVVNPRSRRARSDPRARAQSASCSSRRRPPIRARSDSTADGKRIFLLGNVASTRDVDAAAQIDADGIGLYRTEYLYLAKNRLADRGGARRRRIRSVAVSFTKDPVDIRLLDVGSEKHLPGTSAITEGNPALGLRSLRFLFANPAILETQVRAILQAAAEGPVRLLLPMVADPEDVDADSRDRGARARVPARRGSPPQSGSPVGAMIEHPAGVAMAEDIVEAADFVSVGTNDLTMYVLAVDRDAAHLASYYDPMHPAVIRVLASLVRIADEAGKPLSICGEMAGDPSLTGFLVGMGITRSVDGPAMDPSRGTHAGVDRFAVLEDARRASRSGFLRGASALPLARVPGVILMRPCPARAIESGMRRRRRAGEAHAS